jgi:hypothetical protein
VEIAHGGIIAPALALSLALALALALRVLQTPVDV